MRARWLKPEFFKDRKIGALGPIPALVYEALWCLSDDYGTAPCTPETVKGEMFMFWPSVGLPEVSEALRSLSDARRIIRYTIGDDDYAIIVNFDKHQKVHNPSQFRHPPPPSDVTSSESVSLGSGTEDIGTPPTAVGSPHILDSYTPRIPSKNGKTDHDQEFEELWSLYPKRAGGNSKTDALAAFNARLRKGESAEAMIEGTRRYAAFCDATDKTGTEYVKQARTFLGKGRHYLEPYELPPSNGSGGARSEEATKIWALIKSCGVLHRTTPRERENDIATLVTDGKLTLEQVTPFKNILNKLDFDTLRKAQTPAFAEKHIAERLNGSHLRVA